MNDLSPLERRLLLFILVLTPVAFWLYLGAPPVSKEEPRRSIIAMEMLFRDNLWVPTQTGELYFRKPPMFNWMLILLAKMAGGFTEWMPRLLSVASHWLMAWLTFRMGRQYLGAREGLFAGLFTLVSVDILFYFSLMGENDLFFSLWIMLIFYSMFHFYHENKPYALYPAVYTLAAVGFLTKGLPALVFLAVSLAVHWTLHRRWKELYALAHIAGILVFAAAVGGYFWMYSQHASLELYFQTLFEESFKRAGSAARWERPLHMVGFPLELWVYLLPAALFLVPVMLKHRHLLRQSIAHPYLRWLLAAAVVNVLVYWISPGTRSRYLYMFFPLFIQWLVWMELRRQEEKEVPSLYLVINLLLGLGMIIGGTFLPLLPGFVLLEGGTQWVIALAVLGGFLHIYWSAARPQLALWQWVVALLFLRILMDMSYVRLQGMTGGSYLHRKEAYQILDEAKNEPLFLYKDAYLRLNKVFYIERDRQEVLSRRDTFDRRGFYVVSDRVYPQADTLSNIKMVWSDGEQEFYLIEYQ